MEPDCRRKLLHSAWELTDRFGWTEPDGKVYQIAANNLEVLKEEIYRVCYVSQISGETLVGPFAIGA